MKIYLLLVFGIGIAMNSSGQKKIKEKNKPLGNIEFSNNKVTGKNKVVIGNNNTVTFIENNIVNKYPTTDDGLTRFSEELNNDKEFADAFKPFMRKPKLLKQILLNQKVNPDLVFTKQDIGRLFSQYLEENKRLRDELEIAKTQYSDSVVTKLLNEADSLLALLDNVGYQNKINEILSVNLRAEAKTRKERASFYFLKASNFEKQWLYDSAIININEALQIDSSEIDYRFFRADLYSNRYKLDSSINDYKLILEKLTDTILIIECYTRIGEAYMQGIEFRKALKYLLIAKEIRDEFDKTENPYKARLYASIGAAYTELGLPNLAFNYFDIAIRVYESFREEYTSSLLSLYNSYGLALKTMQMYDDAIVYYNLAIQLAEQYYGANYPGTAVFYGNAGVIYGEKYDFKNGKFYLDKALAIQEHVFGKTHPITGGSYGNIGRIYYLEKKYDSALAYFNKERKINLTYYGNENRLSSAYYNNQGLIYHVKKNYTKAIENYKRAIAIHEHTGGGDNFFALTLYHNLGLAALSNGQLKQAKLYLKKAYDISLNFYGVDNLNTKNILEQIKAVDKGLPHKR